MAKKLIFRGVATALVTPMNDGNIDYPALRRILDAQLSAGIDALVIGGTTGEVATLTDEERLMLYSFVKEHINGRARLIFGAGTNDTAMAIRHARLAGKIGCDGILVVTPYYNKGTHRGVVEHYKRIAYESELPMILYNVPQRTGVNLTLSQLTELAGLPLVVGIKEASDSAERLVELSQFGDDLYLYAGNDSQTYTTLALGGAGVISVVSNAYPEAMLDITRQYFKGNTAGALEGQKRLLDFIKAMFIETNPAPIKYAMSLMGLCKAEPRLPLYIPEKSTRERIKAEIDKLGL